MGLSDTEDKTVWKPTRVRELDAIGVLDMACAETATFALCNDANVYSVGTGLSGQLGHKDIVHEKLVKFRKVGLGPLRVSFSAVILMRSTVSLG